MKNPSSESRIVPCGWTNSRTNRHDEDNSRFSQICEKRLKIQPSNLFLHQLSYLVPLLCAVVLCVATIYLPHSAQWHNRGTRSTQDEEWDYEMNFMVAPCIVNIKHFIVQLMHTNYKIFRLLKYLKL